MRIQKKDMYARLRVNACRASRQCAVTSLVGEQIPLKLLDRSSWDVKLGDFANHFVIEGSFVLRSFRSVMFKTMGLVSGILVAMGRAVFVCNA